MRLTLLVFILLALQGCSIVGSLSSDSVTSSGNFNPLTLQSVDPEKYKADKAQCYKEAQTRSDGNMSDHFNIIKFRQYLVQKGYVLLS